MTERRLPGLLAIGVIVGTAAVACLENEPNICRDNGVNPRIGGSSIELQDHLLAIEQAGVQAFDLFPVLDDHNEFEEIGTLINPDDSGLSSTETAAIVRSRSEFFDAEQGNLIILTNRPFVEQLDDTKLKGVLTREYNGEQVPVWIKNISTQRAGSLINTLEGPDRDNEIVNVRFDLDGSPFKIDTIGLQALTLHLEQVDCATLEPDISSFRTIRFVPVY